MNKGSPYTSNLLITARFSREKFVPDGYLQKRIWQSAEKLRFDHDWLGQRHIPEAETQVATFWTEAHIYFSFRCKYTALNIYEGEDPAKERLELWDRDVVEVFLNPEPEHVEHYYEFEVAPNNQWVDLEIDLNKEAFYHARWDSGFEHATLVDRKHRVWTCEMRIPLRSLGVTKIAPNTYWRINFYRADGLGDDSVRRFLAWSPTLSEKPNFHVPTRFGRIRFVK